MSRIWVVGLKGLGFRRFIVFRVSRFSFFVFKIQGPWSVKSHRGSRASGFQGLGFSGLIILGFSLN